MCRWSQKGKALAQMWCHEGEIETLQSRSSRRRFLWLCRWRLYHCVPHCFSLFRRCQGSTGLFRLQFDLFTCFICGRIIICFRFYVFQTELLDPAVKGTLNVLKSCAKSPTLKRVILTSCIAAVAFNERPKNPNVVVDETWYSDPEYCKRNGVCSVSSHKLSLHLNPYYYTILYHLVLHISCYFLFVF